MESSYSIGSTDSTEKQEGNMSRSKFAANSIHTIVLALTVPFLIVIPAKAQETGNTKSGAADNRSTAESAGASNGSPADGESSAGAALTTASEAATPAKRKKIIFKPGVPLTITTANETIKVTNDAKVAREQVANFPDSPEAHFVLAVALTRTSQVEEALKEVRNARKLSNQKGGAVYFDQMIQEYEKMLANYPEDNEVRYHLAWAYYMKAYVLARYSKGNTGTAPQTVAANQATAATAATTAVQPQSKAESAVAPEDAGKSDTAGGAEKAAKVETSQATAPVDPERAKNWHADWVSQNTVLSKEELDDSGDAKPSASNPKTTVKAADKTEDKGYTNLGEEPEEKKAFTPPVVAPANATPNGGNQNFWSNPLGSLTNLGPITGMEYAKANASPEVIPQIKAYYRRSLKKLDEVLEREPDDMHARLYRAHLNAEYSGDIDGAMKVWESCRDSHPNNPAPYFFLGEGYLKKGDLRNCLTNVSKAIALRGVGN
jgi:tetratricopeptide (TPR) repeat protein